MESDAIERRDGKPVAMTSLAGGAIPHEVVEWLRECVDAWDAAPRVAAARR
jgi:acyl-coenzyme A synthetase/AMP-(fatty) acid ligase